MRNIFAVATALLTLAAQPATAYPNHNVFDQPSTPYGQPWWKPSPEQQVRHLEREIEDMKIRRFNNCVNSRATFCSMHTGTW